MLKTEIEQKAKKETEQMRSLNTYIKNARVFSDFSDKKWDNKIKIFHHNKASIAAARIESNKKRKSNFFGPERMSIVKKKIEFKKDLAVPKAARFGDFLSRIPQDNRIDDANISDIDKR